MSDSISPDLIASTFHRQAELCSAISIPEAHVLFAQVPSHLLADEFCTIWQEYNCALFQSLHLYVRYLKSLQAWDTLLPDIPSESVATIVMDYVFPAFRTICDIPVTFKDQLAKGAVKLAHITRGDYDVISEKHPHRRLNWHKEMAVLSETNDKIQELYAIADEALYRSKSARHFRELHGRFLHDSSVNLVQGLSSVIRDSRGAFLFTYEEPLNLTTELELLRAHLPNLVAAYTAFNEFAQREHRASWN